MGRGWEGGERNGRGENGARANAAKQTKTNKKQTQKLGSKWNIYNVEWKDPIVNGKKVGRGEGAETVK